MTMRSRKLTGVILAAGKGSRMAPFSDAYPKPLLPICNTPILVHQIRQMKSLGIEDVIIVIGHLGHVIARTLGDGAAYGVNIRYVEQQRLLGIAHAVFGLEAHVDGPFLLFLGDIFFQTRDLSPMVDVVFEGGVAGALAVKREPDPKAIRRNFAVILGDDGAVTRVIEKPRHVRTNLKGCGLYLFDLEIFDAIRRTPRTAMRDEYEITESIQILIEDGHRVAALEVVLDDVNMSYPNDLLTCNLSELDRQGKDYEAAAPELLSPGVVLQRSVVGAGVTFEHPIRLSNSLVFPGSRVTSQGDLDGVIITPDKMVDCRAGVTALW
ncbi:MAG: NTP transferase domain-containing protein [Acidobacteria bacterium]|nr:NTP transferase domain-containing protein [Acidobacteriota bacterium]